jgi:predicted choloylglycine hydrolase
MAMRNSVPEEVMFSHVVLEGTSYQVGRQQGEELKNVPQRSSFLTPPLPFLDAYSRREAQRALDYVERYCPGLREEIQGAADSFGVPVEEIAFLGGRNKENGSSSIPVSNPEPGTRQRRGGNNCTQLAVLPSVTQDGHLYAAQNTDFSPGDLDLRLCTTRVQGKPAHIGFSDMIFGRSVGMNEHGLCVTTSWGAPMMWPPCEGLPYFAVVRALLDRCKEVDEALQTLANIPVAWCTNVIVSDRSGVAALIEVGGQDRAVRRIGKESSEQFVCATNHFTFPELHAYSAKRRCESVTRRQTIEARLENGIPQVDREMIRSLLSETFPQGVCLHHYAAGLGTLWSTIFDVTGITLEVCFGAPSSERNPWHSFGLQDPIGVVEYQAHLPDQPAKPGFWDRVLPEFVG